MYDRIYRSINSEKTIGGKNHTWGDHSWNKGSEPFVSAFGYSETITKLAAGFHIRTGDDYRYSDIIDFIELDKVESWVIGRIEDFDPGRVELRIEGKTLDFDNLPSNVRIVEYNGAHNDPGSYAQQWLLIDTGQGHLFYSLEGVRVDMNGDGLSNMGDQEAHFDLRIPNLSQLKDVPYINQFNYVPRGLTPDGGLRINDKDERAEDVLLAIEGSASGDLIAGGLNDDTVNAGAGNDIVWGGSGHDSLNGNAGADDLKGGSGNDVLIGHDGYDRLYGDDGNDRLYGNAGNDSLQGANGNDALNGGTGADQMNGGSGNDAYAIDSTGDRVIEAAGDGRDRINASIDIDLARTGGVYANVEDVVLQGAGNIDARGSAAHNTLIGNSGANILAGRNGNDSLTGGAGADTFLFQKYYDRDIVTDFQNNADTLRVLGFGLTSYSQARTHATQSGDDVVFDFGNGDILTVQDTTINALADDMIFV